MKDNQDKFEETLVAMGFKTMTENGIVYALVDHEQYSDKSTIDTIRKTAVRCEYNGSLGMKLIQNKEIEL